MTYSEFKTKWLGKRVDTDGLYGYQCVDLAKQYLKEVHAVPFGSYGNAIDYWLRTAPVILKKFTRLQSTRVLPGDVVILKTTSTNPYGHIGVADKRYNLANPYICILEQNGSTGSGSGTGPNAIRTRWVLRTRVAGILRRK